MGLGDGLKTLRGMIGKTLDKVLGARPDADSAAAPGAGHPPPMSLAEADQDAAGFPPELR